MLTRRAVALVVCLSGAAAPVQAQDMEPRAYSAPPVGANFFVVSLVGTGMGLYSVTTRRPPTRWIQNHYDRMCFSYVGLVAATTAEILVRVPYFHAVVSGWRLERMALGERAPVAALAGASAALSNLVSNVPAVLLLKSAIASVSPARQTQGWLTLAMASTLSGNLTPIASVANLIVVETARREGVEVSLATYCRVGVPLTLATLVVGTLWLTYVR